MTRTVYWGMNAGATREVAVLGSDAVSVTGIDVSTTQALDSFVRSTGLTGRQQSTLRNILGSAPESKRDELAQLAQLFAQAEHGGPAIERLVLSAHHDASRFWSDASDWSYLNDGVSVEDVRHLLALFPVAARGVHHVMLSACASGYEDAVSAWRSLFPSLLSFTAYGGRSPATNSGALDHLRSWSRNTAHPERIDPSLFGSSPSRFALRNAVTWNISDGYQAPSYALAMQTVTRLMPVLQAYQTNRIPADRAEADTDLATLYYALQTVIHSSHTTDAAEHAKLRGLMLDALVLRHPELALPRSLGLL